MTFSFGPAAAGALACLLLTTTAPVLAQGGLSQQRHADGAAAVVEGRETKEIDFLGFTMDERLSAWRVAYVHHRQIGSASVIDRYSLLRLVESDTRKIVITFRDTPVRRTWVQGRPKGKVSDRQIEAANPAWLEAEPKARWQTFIKRVRLFKKQVDMDDSAVRVYTDDDAEPELRVTKEHISAIAGVGQPLGYAPIARRMDGTYMNLGHYRMEAIPGVTLTSTVEVFRSRTAKHLAVICRFYHKDDEIYADSMATVASTGTERFATNTIGAEEMLDVETELGGKIFMQQFPEIKNMYEFYVGKRW